MMLRSARRGQATAEFAIAITIFTLLIFGGIEGSRAVFEKHSLARAAETITQELAQTDPANAGINSSSWSMGASDVATAIADANRQAHLNLNTVWSPPTGPATFSYNPADNMCDKTPGPNDDTCQSVPNQDGSVMIIGTPDLYSPTTIKVTVSQPYRSFIAYPLPLLGGNASETVAASTLIDQQQ